MAHDAHTLLGSYFTPLFNYGDVVTCTIRGDAVIVGLSDAPIPWPLGKKAGGKGQRQRFLILYDALADAVHQDGEVNAGQGPRFWTNAAALAG